MLFEGRTETVASVSTRTGKVKEVFEVKKIIWESRPCEGGIGRYAFRSEIDDHELNDVKIVFVDTKYQIDYFTQDGQMFDGHTMDKINLIQNPAFYIRIATPEDINAYEAEQAEKRRLAEKRAALQATQVRVDTSGKFYRDMYVSVFGEDVDQHLFGWEASRIEGDTNEQDFQIDPEIRAKLTEAQILTIAKMRNGFGLIINPDGTVTPDYE